MKNKYICDVCQTACDIDAPSCPLCGEPNPYLTPDTPAPEARSAWKTAAMAALCVLFVALGLFIAYEFLFGHSSAGQTSACTGLYLPTYEITLTESGQTANLDAHATPEDTSDEIVYASADKSVVTVSGSGTLTAVAEGTAQITVTCGSYTAECTVTCDFS